MAEVVTCSLSLTRFISSSSKIGLNFNLVLGSLMLSCPKLAKQSLLSVELVLVE